jgi:peptidoglycan hydrolase-like protein with peptidoglycan-binding domain
MGGLNLTKTSSCTRRYLLSITAGVAGLGAYATGGAAGAAGQPAASPAASSRIEPVTVKRRGVGLRGHDPDRAFAGFTLFCPLPSDNRTVYLIDMQGKVVHTWAMPHPPGQSGYLTERGTLFYNGQIPNESHVGRAPYRGGAALEMDWNGRILWEVRHADHNHDGIRLRNGNVLLICQKPLPDGFAPKVRGGRHGTEYDDGKMDAPYLVEMTTDGKAVWEWRSWDHLDPVADVITAVQDDRDVWTVGNGVSEMPDGNILLSFRDISTVVMINRQTGAIYWKLGAPPLAGQHAPYMLANGHVLLFDNGPHRLDQSFPHSRVLEIDPETKAIVWKYQETRLADFFSPRLSNAQRLPNGNTLINEGWFGRFFEVTRDGDVVWEYVNPYFGTRQKLVVNAVQRAYRYTAEEIAKARTAT